MIVEDEEKDKTWIIHDATHGVRVNHRVRCRDKIRAPDGGGWIVDYSAHTQSIHGRPNHDDAGV